MAGLPGTLLASGRAAYRNVLRAARVTFAGDERVLVGFHGHVREAFVEGRSIQTEDQYKEKIALANDVAKTLRENIIQGVKEEDNEVYKLQWRPEIELGDNSTIKNPPPIPPKGKRTPKAANSTTPPLPASDTHPSTGSTPDSASTPLSSADTHSNLPRPKTTYKALLQAHKKRAIPELKEEDIVETFVRGSGPGGQAINKTKSNVSLVHKPTGIRVTCQETRSLETNRMLARRILLEKLDQQLNPGLSKQQIKAAKERDRKRQRKHKSNRKKRAAEAETTAPKAEDVDDD